MAIAHDLTSSAAGAVIRDLTYSHTVTGLNRLLVVGVAMNSSTNSGVTYAGTAMGDAVDINAGGGLRGRMIRLVAPATGPNNVVVSQAALDNITSYASSYTGVDQTTPMDAAATASGNSTAPSVTVTTGATDDLIIDCVNDGGSGTMTVDASQTERANHRGGGNGAGIGCSTEAGAASVVMSWTKGTSGIWGMIGRPINPAAGGGGGTALQDVIMRGFVPFPR